MLRSPIPRDSLWTPRSSLWTPALCWRSFGVTFMVVEKFEWLKELEWIYGWKF